MSSILFAWQLGANYGHLLQELPIGRALRERGHEVIFAPRDLRRAAECILPAAFPFVMAPSLSASLDLGFAPGNYAEILLAEGFADDRCLAGLVQGWLSLLELVQPDVIVLDYAPMARLAAKCLAIPCVQLSTGFDLPPPGAPLPSIRPWEHLPEERLRFSESQVLDRINRILELHHRTPVGSVSDFANEATTFLLSIPELDHFGPRRGIYLGPLAAEQQGVDRIWPDAGACRILGYLRPSVTGVNEILAELSKLPAHVLCFMPDTPEAKLDEFRHHRIDVVSRPLNLGALLPGADWLITTGGVGTTAAALLAGVPVLLIPQVIEQHLLGLKLRKTGAGMLLDFDRGKSTVTAIVAQLRKHTPFSLAAAALRDKYASYRPGVATAEIVAAIETLIERSRA